MVEPMLRWVPVWYRNFLVWRRLLLPSLIGNFGEPLLYLFGLGYGLGFFLGEMQGVPYLYFLASGIVCSSAMTTASFESTYSAFTRMKMQRTWDAMLASPLTVADILRGEAFWAGSKSMLSATAILCVSFVLGASNSWIAMWAIPVALLTGICFATLGLVMTTMAMEYDSFTFYFTLFLTPLSLLSGVFFPTQNLPETLQWVISALPLYHAIELIRPLVLGAWPQRIGIHLAVLIGYAVMGFHLARLLAERRLRQG